MASHGVPRAATTVARSEKQHQEEQVEILQYQSLVELIELKVSQGEYTAQVLQLTSKLLTKNPEYYTIWNVRRRLLILGLFSKSSALSSHSKQSRSTSLIDTTSTSAGTFSSFTSSTSEASIVTPPALGLQNPGQSGTTLDLIKKDLNFIIPLLKKWPKCYWIWNHRIWLLQQATERLYKDAARVLWLDELALVAIMLVKDSRNFHGWGYRRFVVENLERSTLGGKSMVEDEFAYTTKMINAHLSNFSAWHYRSKLIPRLLNERNADFNARRQFLDNGESHMKVTWDDSANSSPEFDIMKNALWTDASDQSLWFYYKFLMTTLIEPAGHGTIVPSFSNSDRVEYVSRQLCDLRDMLDGEEDCKWIHNALIQYTLALCDLEERTINNDETSDLQVWLEKLRKLDPLRSGRWDELDDSLRLQRTSCGR